MLVLDSSALFSMDQLPEEESVCPPGVIDELTKYKDHRLDLWGDLLRVSECTSASIKEVECAARKSGDLGRLSPVDITVLALALDVNGTILTDDYSIQNTAKIIGIPYRAVGQNGIKKVERWNYRCIGCGKWFKEKADECPICGSSMRSYRKHRSREQMFATDEFAHPAGTKHAHAQRGSELRLESESICQILVAGSDFERFVKH